MSKLLTDRQIVELIKEYDLEEDLIRTVIEVEAPRGGFDSRGRVTILFEPHVFYRNINVRSVRDRAVQEGLAYRTWGQMRYPADSYPRFSKAFQLDPVAAMKACSWGKGQVLGENHVYAGFDDIHAMVDSFKISEANQVRGMLSFIKNRRLDGALRRQNWREFARGYNGSGYEKNNYHVKLQRAYEKWSKIPDIQLDEEKKCAT